MSDDGDENTGRLGDQLDELDLEAPDRKEREESEEQTDSSESDSAASDDSESDAREPSPEREFEEALEDLSEEDLRARKFDRGPDEARERGTLADDLSELDAEQYPEQAEERGGPSGRSGDPSDGADRASEGSRSLEEALEGMSPDEMRDRKFSDDPGASGGAGGSDVNRSAEPEGGRGSDARGSAASQDDGPGDPDEPVDEEVQREFERAMFDVDPIEEDSKYREGDVPDPDAYFEEESTRTPEDFATPLLPKSGEGLNDIPKLDEAQEAMLERCEEWERDRDVPELNLRGEEVDDAVGRLTRFVEQARAQGARFIRVVHGKGRRSDGPPVIKPAVLKWLERSAADRIRGYVPEREFGGDYGSTVVELLDRG